MNSRIPQFKDIQDAAKRIAPYIHTTPVMTSHGLNQISGHELFFKCENLQRSGAFKMRGAMNTLLQLTDEERLAGVITHSSGNHAGAVALAAQQLGIRCHVVMPENAPACKREAVTSYGAEITTCEHGMPARIAAVEKLMQSHPYTLVHPFDDARVIAGQGTATLELLMQLEPDLDAIVLPVGGGGLMAGCCQVVKAMQPEIAIYGAEPEVVGEARESLLVGERQPATGAVTMADGLQAGIGELNFAIIQGAVSDIITVTEEEILQALQLMWERLKLIIEPSSAVPLAALMAGKLPPSHRRVGIILSGGNIDISQLCRLIRH